MCLIKYLTYKKPVYIYISIYSVGQEDVTVFFKLLCKICHVLEPHPL
jgi:hypothetical protein